MDGSDRLARRIVDDLRGDVALGEMDGETRALGRSCDFLAKALMADWRLLVDADMAYWTVLPSLRRTCSPT